MSMDIDYITNEIVKKAQLNEASSREKPPAIKKKLAKKGLSKLNRECSLDAFKHNIRREYHAGQTAQGTQHVAIALSVLKRSCGVDSKGRMTPKEIVAAGQKEETMNLEAINATLAQAIGNLQESELESIQESQPATKDIVQRLNAIEDELEKIIPKGIKFDTDNSSNKYLHGVIIVDIGDANTGNDDTFYIHGPESKKSKNGKPVISHVVTAASSKKDAKGKRFNATKAMQKLQRKLIANPDILGLLK